MSSLPRILIVGHAGQVGVELRRSFADAGEIICHDRDTVDLAVPDQVRAMVRSAAPDIILNAAAYTAVDRAESEPEAALAVNATAPGIMAEEAQRTGGLLVHYSTGPWTETDKPNPLNVYGASKLAGEAAIQQVGGRYLIFRTSWVYGPHGNNFLLTMLRLARESESINVVDDQHGAPTSSIELADATRVIVDGVMTGTFRYTNNWAGIYHMTNSGSTSWCGFARAIFVRAGALLHGKVPAIKPISSAEYYTPAIRPNNSVLLNEKLFTCFGYYLAPWESSLDAVILRLAGQRPAKMQLEEL
jgi:dTDP-4-dehydrorhamnose reductase